MVCEHCDCYGLASVEPASTLAVGREQHGKGFSCGLQLDKEFVLISQIEWNKNDHEFRRGSLLRNTEGFYGQLSMQYLVLSILRESL